MSFDRKKYPREWQQIRERILQRADNRCEGSPAYPDCRAENGKPHPVTGAKVALTCAHWPDPTPANVSDENLHANCQRCHLATDRWLHQRNAARTRRQRRVQRQPPLPFDPYDQALWEAKR